MKGAALALSAALVLVGCRSSRDAQRRIVLRDVAELCVGEAEPGDAGIAGPVTIARDKALPVVVRSSCLGTCATDRKAKCSVQREADRLVVSSELSWSAPYDIGSCPGPCTVLEAKCTTEPFAGATVSIAHGNSRWTLDAPSRLASGCLGAGVRREGGLDAGTREAVSSAAAPPDPTPTASSIGAITEAGTGAPSTPPRTDAICALPYPSKGKPEKGAPIGITVTRPNPCVGASCSAMTKPKCTLKRRGNRLLVKTDLPVPGAKPRQPCTEDCGGLLASCRTEPLPSGTYTIEHGDQKLTVALPIAKEVCTP